VPTSTPAAEPGEDWESLFDGKSLDGWEGSTAGYRAENGVLVCTTKGGSLYTTKQYGDFMLHFEFKLTPGANNGLGVRAPRQGNPAYAGMELQILDNTAQKYAGLKDYQYHGSIYGVVPAKRGHLNPVGEWNSQQVICIGHHVKVVLNGTTIVDAQLDKVTPLDGKGHPGLQRKQGHLVFCGHNAHVEFRNLRIREFGMPPPSPATSGDNTPPPGFEALFNGKDLAGWKGLVRNPKARANMPAEQLAAEQAKADENMRAHWRVEDGVLVFDGKGRNLCTAKDYGDFDLYVDWKIPAHADSGLYLRGSPQVQIWDPTNEGQWKHGADKGSGALWNNRKAGNRPLVKADKPTGEWNTFFIRMVGENVTIYLNGQLVLDDVVMENYWERDKPIYRTGSIELQNHGSALYFKNLYLRELPF
jgi:hypothetical protein